MLQIDFLISNAIHAILMPKVTMLLGYRRAEVGIRLGYGWVVVLKKTVHYFINCKNIQKQNKKRTAIKGSLHKVELSIRESIVVQL